MLRFDLYWSFRSPYCYIVTSRLRRLCLENEVECRVCPVYPHAVRMRELHAQRSPLWFSYFKTDIVRTAEFFGLPFAWPRPDPVATDPASGAALPEQPLIRRLTSLGACAAELGEGLAFIDEVSRVLWHPETTDWTAPGLLAAAARRAGLDFGAMEASVVERADHFDRIIAINHDAQIAAGHWGVPLMVFENEPFFGQDRFEQLLWRMRQRGLARRSEGVE